MKNFILISAAQFYTMILFAGTTPQTISMTGNNASVFGADGTLGMDGATFYTHWDATSLFCRN